MRAVINTIRNITPNGRRKIKEEKLAADQFVVRGIDLLIPHYVIALALLYLDGKEKLIRQWSQSEFPNATEYILTKLDDEELISTALHQIDFMEAIWNQHARKLHFHNYVEALVCVLSEGVHKPVFKTEIDTRVEEVYGMHLAEMKSLSVDMFSVSPVESSIPAAALARILTGQNIFPAVRDHIVH